MQKTLWIKAQTAEAESGKSNLASPNSMKQGDKGMRDSIENNCIPLKPVGCHCEIVIEFRSAEIGVQREMEWGPVVVTP